MLEKLAGCGLLLFHFFIKPMDSFNHIRKKRIDSPFVLFDS
ncbi:Uncharacterised protein [Mycobacteroides abscessus subsp. abscessus]|nr:Uncharacterised protein [Mycobacteroides abscessus subsp. abscessus]